MSTDYAEKERDFIASLNEDTGRDLAGWMAAITESGLSERNAIIDWLRHRGFQFARASWLERIHHNGGRLIYADVVEHAQRSSRISAPTRVVDEEPPARDPAQILRPTPKGPSPPGDDIQRLLADAKGLRPLAELILREVARIIPDVEYGVANALISMSAPVPFAALLPGPKKLRLYANFGQAATERTKAAEAVNKTVAPFAEMLLLDDARSIDEEFRRLIRAAAHR
jgi:hypothetical protein